MKTQTTITVAELQAAYNDGKKTGCAIRPGFTHCGLDVFAIEFHKNNKVTLVLRRMSKGITQHQYRKNFIGTVTIDD